MRGPRPLHCAQSPQCTESTASNKAATIAHAIRTLKGQRRRCERTCAVGSPRMSSESVTCRVERAGSDGAVLSAITTNHATQSRRLAVRLITRAVTPYISPSSAAHTSHAPNPSHCSIASAHAPTNPQLKTKNAAAIPYTWRIAVCRCSPSSLPLCSLGRK